MLRATQFSGGIKKNIAAQLVQCMKLSTSSVTFASAQSTAVEPQRVPDILYTGVSSTLADNSFLLFFM